MKLASMFITASAIYVRAQRKDNAKKSGLTYASPIFCIISMSHHPGKAPAPLLR